jgi:hypothetical protein
LFPLNFLIIQTENYMVLTIKAINSDCNLFHKSNNTGNRIRNLTNPKRPNSNFEKQYSQRDNKEIFNQGKLKKKKKPYQPFKNRLRINVLFRRVRLFRRRRRSIHPSIIAIGLVALSSLSVPINGRHRSFSGFQHTQIQETQRQKTKQRRLIVCEQKKYESFSLSLIKSKKYD